ncbi:hypothetical protein Q8A67_006381 [Cirrhinus molitorella]|uniref:C1q domain-containing protein n=1 Tax=Cirrhinus molitorella TaxID=172907 RepID=A0AA88Q0F8_9TELE|nr:hypothetical protein Q8A67_006381 [Cirrhinus molitorella]
MERRGSEVGRVDMVKYLISLSRSDLLSRSEEGEREGFVVSEQFIAAAHIMQQVDGRRGDNEINQQLSNEDRRQNPPQTDSQSNKASTDSKKCCHACFPDIHAALRELTATVTEQKAHIRDLETRLREEMNKKTDEISKLTLSQVEQLQKENRDREIAFSAGLYPPGKGGYTGPSPTEFTLIYCNVFTNIGNAYNPVTGVFTAPLKGAYMFKVSVFDHGFPENPATAAIVKNGQRVVVAYAHQSQGAVSSSNEVVLILEAGHVVYVRLPSGSKLYDDDKNLNTFSGYLLFPLKS